MQHQPSLDIGRLAQRALDADAVVRHGTGHAVQAASSQIGELATQAKAKHPGLAHAFGAGAQRVQRRTDILDAEGLIEALIQAQGALEVLAAIAQFDARGDAPEQVRHQHRVAFFGVVVRHGAHGGVDAEDFLAQHNAGPLARCGRGEVGAERAATVGGVDLDGLAHGLRSFVLGDGATVLDSIMGDPHRSKLAAGCSGYPISAGKYRCGQGAPGSDPL